ncbi:hypothetical protein T10_3776 [Trichinella papuae]|uniref:Uncharacterized protein n=1 Tax=Trichinella papuae TaxID=268474 RepID=A0A0V1M7Q8_9BILA|nr:hypothetical protein T10_3776 [Trichinella papuae]
MSQHCSKHRLRTCVDRSKLIFNEESSDKTINHSSAFVDMPVATRSACCERLDRSSDSQVIDKDYCRTLIFRATHTLTTTAALEHLA